jgi:hypothetical protein
LKPRNGLLIELQKQQIFEIKPYAGFQAAGLGAPGTGVGTHLVKNGKDRFQAALCFLR